MRILINSDILYSSRLTKLPHQLQKFADECAKTGAVIVLPRTTLLEIEKHQTDLMNKEIAELETAYELLRNTGIQFEERPAAELFALPDIAELFRQSGAKVEIEDPTLEDFNDAHRRACLHLSPQPAETKYDEMRDLVIWAMALRIAKRDGGAALLSRDKIHTDDRGMIEASAVRLVRIASVDDMLEKMGIESPGGQLARLLLEPIWDDLRAAGLPLLQAVDLRKIDKSVFKQGEKIIEQAAFDFKASADKGAILAAHIEIITKDEMISAAILDEITIDGQPWAKGTLKIAPNRPAPLDPLEVKERLDALREVIGG